MPDTPEDIAAQLTEAQRRAVLWRPATEPVVSGLADALTWLRTQGAIYAGGVSVPGSALKAIADCVERHISALRSPSQEPPAADDGDAGYEGLLTRARTLAQRDGGDPFMTEIADAIRTLTARLAEREEEIEWLRDGATAQVLRMVKQAATIARLREALRPFARLGGPIHEGEALTYIDQIDGPNGTGELQLTTYVGDGQRIELLYADDFTRAHEALATPEQARDADPITPDSEIARESPPRAISSASLPNRILQHD